MADVCSALSCHTDLKPKYLFRSLEQMRATLLFHGPSRPSRKRSAPRRCLALHAIAVKGNGTRIVKEPHTGSDNPDTRAPLLEPIFQPELFWAVHECQKCSEHVAL
jgi:hypothetical protein